MPYANLTIGAGIAAYEQGELDQEEVVELFQALVDTGVVWQLQGSYGRTAVDLIEAGLVRPVGDLENVECPEDGCDVVGVCSQHDF